MSHLQIGKWFQRGASRADVGQLRPTFNETQMAVVCLPQTSAASLVRKRALVVGCFSCQIGQRVAQQRCFECLNFGHVAFNCKSTVGRTSWCFRFAQDLLEQSAREVDADIAILSEPFKAGDGTLWAVDLTTKAAICVCGQNMPAMESMATFSQKSGICGDFKAWSEEWGSSSSNDRGRTLLEAWAILEIAVLNTGSNWKLCDSYTGSDHLAIFCTSSSAFQRPNHQRTNQRDQIFRVDTLNPSNFESALSIPRLDGDASRQAETIIGAVRAGCKASMKVRSGHSRALVYWDEDIAEAKKKVSSSQEALSKIAWQTRVPVDATLRFSKKLRAVKPAAPDEGRMAAILETLFPATSSIGPKEMMHTALPVDWLITGKEVILAAARLQNNKASGPDTIPNKALKLAIDLQPGRFAEVLNACMGEGTFPDRWKWQNLLLIPKPNKPAEDLSAYRPICHLDPAGKLFERLLSTRIEAAIKAAGDFSPMQYRELY
ncbi:uncharacterized protein LOC124460839 [Drosophila willistoni]|uniref:uncharacterized protein LOC124460839 n=1 Tax=Drosophila willistoni TaxID=7260 RepID=UPI001F081B58|nr:uncharacterized protein LOC124460839 [Drosophila willistoni]